ncbi:MAG: hypothetical protein V3T23_02620, partial [Nitrososphaerales archaeon]
MDREGQTEDAIKGKLRGANLRRATINLFRSEGTNTEIGISQSPKPELGRYRFDGALRLEVLF